jgi:hypothetical protein
MLAARRRSNSGRNRVRRILSCFFVNGFDRRNFSRLTRTAVVRAATVGADNREH